MRKQTLKQFLLIADFISSYSVNTLSEAGCPRLIAGKTPPADLNDLSFGELMELQNISTKEDAFIKPAMVVLRLSREQALKCQSREIVPFSYWCADEVKRIGELFKSTSSEPTSEERQAGAEHLQFGLFGIIDWFALRMGITDHNEVINIPWIRIYKCLEMDHQKNIYEKRLREIYAKKQKA